MEEVVLVAPSPRGDFYLRTSVLVYSCIYHSTMCTTSCLQFVYTQLTQDMIKGKDILEVGSYDVNGSIQPFLERFDYKSYRGVDIILGPGVDSVCDVGDLVKEFGEESFDIVITTEMMEHVQDWKRAINNMKQVLRPGGMILITTRSKGFHLHDYPGDYWRFSQKDMEYIFSDFEEVYTESDPVAPGVFLSAVKPKKGWKQRPIGKMEVYSMEQEKKK